MQIKGYINIYKADSMLQTSCAIYEMEKQAIEIGKMVRGYKMTLPIEFELPNEEEIN